MQCAIACKMGLVTLELIQICITGGSIKGQPLIANRYMNRACCLRAAIRAWRAP